MRLNLAHLVWSNEAKSAQAIRFAALPQLFQTRQFRFAGCDDDLAAYFVRNAMLTEKLPHGRRSRHAQSRFLRSGLVVNPGVDDAAVVSALVAGDAIFLLQDQEPELRKAECKFHRHIEGEQDSSHADL